MNKYRKKPVEIEAIQLTEENLDKIMEFCGDKIKSHPLTGVVIETLEGNMTADKGDYIIKGIKGEFYPCKPDIFELTYEKVELSNRHKNALKNTFPDLVNKWETTGLLDINTTNKIDMGSLLEGQDSQLLKEQINQLEELNDYLRMLADMDKIGIRRKLFLLEGYMNKVISQLKNK
jgi:hypothetical protein